MSERRGKKKKKKKESEWRKRRRRRKDKSDCVLGKGELRGNEGNEGWKPEQDERVFI